MTETPTKKQEAEARRPFGMPQDWITAALMVLTFYVITLVAFMPWLSKSELFRTLAQAVVITGLLSIALAYHYNAVAVLTARIDELKAMIASNKEP